MTDIMKSPLKDVYYNCEFFEDSTYITVGGPIVLECNHGYKKSDTIAVIGGVEYEYDSVKKTLTKREVDNELVTG